eukprot:COSAG05_NODE_9739_length_604_cov_428.245545_1_plen_75_part_10
MVGWVGIYLLLSTTRPSICGVAPLSYSFAISERYQNKATAHLKHVLACFDFWDTFTLVAIPMRLKLHSSPLTYAA